MAKVEITDINKLAPELLEKSSAQLEREITERQMALAEISRREEEQKRAALTDEAGKRMDQIVDNLKWLHDSGFMSQKIKDAFTTAGGVFAPHLSFKRPR